MMFSQLVKRYPGGQQIIYCSKCILPLYNVLRKTKFLSSCPEQNSLAIKQYQTSFFESLMPEQNRNKPNYIGKKSNVKTESTQQAREI